MISLIFFFITISFTSNGQFFDESKNYEGSSDLVDLQYHMGPVISSPETSLYIIWYGRWNPTHQSTIRDFLYSVSSPTPVQYPSVSDWWKKVRLYRDQTGATVYNAYIEGLMKMKGNTEEAIDVFQRMKRERCKTNH